MLRLFLFGKYCRNVWKIRNFQRQDRQVVLNLEKISVLEFLLVEQFAGHTERYQMNLKNEENTLYLDPSLQKNSWKFNSRIWVGGKHLQSCIQYHLRSIDHPYSITWFLERFLNFILLTSLSIFDFAGYPVWLGRGPGVKIPLLKAHDVSKTHSNLNKSHIYTFTRSFTTHASQYIPRICNTSLLYNFRLRKIRLSRLSKKRKKKKDTV